MQPTFKWIYLLCSSLTLTSLQACYTHADCSTANTTAYCVRVRCIPLSGYGDLAPGVPSSNLSRRDFEAIVNSDPVPLDVRRATIRQIVSIAEKHNVNYRLYRTIHKRSLPTLLARVQARQTRHIKSFAFHTALLDALRQVHDLHFRYFPPNPLRGATATLGFTVSRYYPRKNDGRPAFVVTDFVPGFRFPGCFVRGSHVRLVDRIPVVQAVEKLARFTSGSNEHARAQYAVDALTIRQAMQEPLPKSEYSRFTVRTPSGKLCHAQLRWVFSISIPEFTLSPSSKISSLPRPLSTPPSHVNPLAPVDHFFKHSFVARKVSFPRRTYLPVNTPLNLFVSASVAHTLSGDLGILKLSGFPIEPSSEVLGEFTRILRALPQNGLVIDTRDNLGGLPSLCRALTRLISPVHIPEARMTARTSDVFLRMLDIPTNLTALQPTVAESQMAVRHALQVGEEYTGPMSDASRLLLTPGFDFGAIKQVYKAPVITLTSATTYSAGDFFASLQKDLGASYTVGMDDTTGGGGAATFPIAALNQAYPGLFPNTQFAQGIDLGIPFFRFYRTGNNTGGLVEHFGVEPNEVYKRRKRDVLDGDRDLFEYLAKKLTAL